MLRTIDTRLRAWSLNLVPLVCPSRCFRSASLIWLMLLPLIHLTQAQVTERKDSVGTQLNEWYRSGKAAGLSAISYENRDGQHSPLNTSLYPQLQIYKPDSKSGPPIGPASQLRMMPIVGNCSMSAPATQGGSLPRFYQMTPDGTKFVMMQYLTNNLLIYPEHQDYDIGANGVGGYGDLYPANNCCTLISQGSSGSDQPFLQAVLATIAAFPPDTQEALIRQRILMPTVQAIFRQSNKMVVKDADYFSGIAHPPVFDSAKIDEEKMIRLAQEMTPAKIPPLVQISVVEETDLSAGRHYFEKADVMSHKLADTPVAISRIMRGNVDQYGMVVHLGKTADIIKRPVKIMFQVLQGDPRLIQIEHSAASPYARIKLRWHPPMTTATGIRSHRVDIGIFSTNGLSVSAPAIISFYMLPNERRFYDTQGRLSEIDYHARNPDPGLPVSPKDTRWLRAMLDTSITSDGLRSRLMEKMLSPVERKAIQALWIPLDERLQVIRGLESKPSSKDSAARLRADLEKDLSAALDTKLPGDRGLTVKSAIARSLDTLSTISDLYPSLQKELQDLAASSPKKTAEEDIRAEVNRLIELGILIEQADGIITTVTASDKLSPSERYHLHELNLTVLSQVIFPDSLDRSTAPAWVDPRLTTPKPWRDIFRHDEATGRRLGWIRHQGGRTHWFDAEGRLLPDGPKHPEKAVPVTYQINDKGLLEWR